LASGGVREFEFEKPLRGLMAAIHDFWFGVVSAAFIIELFLESLIHVSKPLNKIQKIQNPPSKPSTRAIQ
jgi:hypothetical protein